MTTYWLTIHDIVQETSDTKSFLLKGTTEKITYQPGQFLTLLHPLHSTIRRSYSLSSHPVLDEYLRITVKRIPNGEYSRWLFDEAKAGDQIETIGASGFFTFPEPLEENTTLLFLAAGSGITPIFSLLKEILFFHKQRIIFIDSNRTKEDIIFHNDLLKLKEKFGDSRLHLELLVSSDKNLLRARLSKSLLAEFISMHIKDRTKAMVYLCGPRDYMQMALITLINENIALENIRTEIFNTEKPKVRELPADTDKHNISINYQGKRFQLAVQYPTTILQAAQREGIELPYSCEAGRCGTCAATCTSGKIWMSRNEVLLDKETSKGRVLTCTGYAIGGDAELVIKG